MLDEKIIHKYLDDRQSLTEDELDQMILVLENNTSLTEEIKELLIVDDLLSRANGIDRQYFPERVLKAALTEKTSDHFEQSVLKKVKKSKIVKKTKKVEDWQYKPKPRRSVMPFVFSAIAASFAVVCGIYFYIQQHQPKPGGVQVAQGALAVLSNQNGEILVRRGKHVQKPTPDFELQENDYIITNELSTASLIYPDNSKVDLLPNSELKIFTEAEAKRLNLVQGVISANFAKQPKGKNTKLLTANGQAEIIGTVFQLSVRGKTTRLDVTEGKVSLMDNKGRKTIVKSGQYAVSGLSSKPVAINKGKLHFPDLSGMRTYGNGKWQVSGSSIRQISDQGMNAEKGITTSLIVGDSGLFYREFSCKVKFGKAFGHIRKWRYWGMGVSPGCNYGIRIFGVEKEIKGGVPDHAKISLSICSNNDKNGVDWNPIVEPKIPYPKIGLEYSLFIKATKKAGQRLRMQAKFWPATEPEPKVWLIDKVVDKAYYDLSPSIHNFRCKLELSEVSVEE